MIRLALRQRFARQLLTDAILQLEVGRLAIPDVGHPGLRVAVRAYYPQILVPGRGAEGDLQAGQLRLQPAIVLLERLVLEVAPYGVVLVVGKQNAVVDLRHPGVDDVHMPQRIALHLDRGAAHGIQEIQFAEVQRLLVGDQVDLLVGRVETEDAAALEHRAAIDLLEAVGIDPQNFHVAHRVGALREPQGALVIEHPGGDVLGVLAQQRFLAARDVQLVQIVPAWIAVVQADVENVRLGLRHGEYFRAHALEVGERPGRWHAGTGVRRQRRVDRIDIEILIAARILGVQNVLGVVAPEIGADGTSRFRAHGPRRAERFVRPLHPNVARALVRLEKRYESAVGGDLCARDGDLAEEQVAVYQRRLFGENRHGGRGAGQCGNGQYELLHVYSSPKEAGFCHDRPPVTIFP